MRYMQTKRLYNIAVVFVVISKFLIFIGGKQFTHIFKSIYIGNTFKQQMNAAKAVAGAIKAVKDGTVDESVAENTISALDAAQYGDRTEWIAKADAALATVQK